MKIKKLIMVVTLFVGCSHALFTKKSCPTSSEIAQATKGKSKEQLCTTSSWTDFLKDKDKKGHLDTHYSTDCCHTWDMCSTLSEDCFTGGKAAGDADKSACAKQCKKIFGDKFFTINVSACYADLPGTPWEVCTQVKDTSFSNGKGKGDVEESVCAKSCKDKYGDKFFTLPKTTPDSVKNNFKVLNLAEQATCSLIESSRYEGHPEQKSLISYRGCK
jgi:hypothetical protein